jgi:hypothetical protein
VRSKAIIPGKREQAVKCSLAISKVEREGLLNDRAIDELELGIVIESSRRGLWSKDEAEPRESLEPQYW